MHKCPILSQVRWMKAGGVVVIHRLIHQLRSALHCLPVVFVRGSADHADLIMTSVFTYAGPGEAMRACAMEELI